MTKDEKKQFAITQYTAGDTVRAICDAIGITTPTFYRWIKDHPDFVPRKPDLINKETEPSTLRSEIAKTAWRKRFGNTVHAVREHIQKQKHVPLLDILKRFNLSLSLDNQGHAIVHHDKPGRLYLTEAEFKLLTKDPVTHLKSIANRINQTFGG